MLGSSMQSLPTGYLPLSGGTLTGATTVNDDVALALGTGSTVSILYETADANANATIFAAPEGDATDVPAFIFGDASILNADLGWFNGLTEPSIVVVNDAKDAYIRIDAGDDAVAGSQGIYFKAASDEDIELLNLSVTGTPRVFWDESEDMFSSSKGWAFTGNINFGTYDLLQVNKVYAIGVASYIGMWAGGAGAGKGAYLEMAGSDTATGFALKTSNAAKSADVTRLSIENNQTTAAVTWAAVNHNFGTGTITTNSLTGVASFGPSVVTSITVTNGIVTAIS